VNGSQPPERLPREAASRQVVAGDIPVEPSGFQPRADLLAELDRPRVRVPVIHVITGFPGAGKTMLAAAYARAKLAAGWRLVAWVSAEDTWSLLAGLARTADAAGLYEGDAAGGTADAGRLLRRRLEGDGDRCLLVFDDMRDPDLLLPFLPIYGAARVLITGPGRSSAIAGTTVPVGVFSDDEAVAFLTGRTGQADAEGAAALAAELGHLPLALAQAAAVIAGQSLGYRAYLERLRAVPVEESLVGEVGQPSVPGVVQAVLLSLEASRAADQADTGSRVIEILAVLSAAGVRRDLLHAAGQAGALTASGHQVAAALVDEALARLAERSLVTVSLDGGQTIIMHRTVMLVVRAELARRQQLTAACRLAASVLEARAKAVAVPRNRPAVRDIPRQVSALMDNAAGPAGEDKDLARALLRLRSLALYHLIELGDCVSQAIAFGEPLTADLERMLGPDHPETLNARNSLAAAYRAAGRDAEAIRLFERTMVTRQLLLGPDHPDTLTSQNNLAAAYQDEGRSTDAVLLFELTLASRERLLGADHPSTLNSRGNLAAAYRDVGRLAEAIPLFEQTLADRERLLGPGHPDTLRSRSSLAAAYRDAGRAAPANLVGAKNLPAEEAPPAREVPAEEEVPPDDETLPAAEVPPDEEVPPEDGTPPVEEVPAAEEVPAEEEAPSEDENHLVGEVLPAGEASPEEEAPPDDETLPVVEVPAAEGAASGGESLSAGRWLRPRRSRRTTRHRRSGEVPAVGELPAAEEVTPDGESVSVEEVLAVEEVTPDGESLPAEEVAAAEEVAPDGEAPSAGEVPAAEEVLPAAEVSPEEELLPEDENLPVGGVAAAEEALGELEPERSGPEPPAAPEVGSKGRPARLRRLRVLGVVAAILILLAAGAGVTLAFYRPHVASRTSGHAAAPARGPVQMAAAWVSQQVSRSAIVACDPTMCAALEALGMPATNLLVIGSSTKSPLGADVVVATPAVRSRFGSRLDTVYAPLVIASFGSGPGQVDVQVVAPDGAPAYLAALRQDVAARQAAGAQLLANKRITLTAQARTQLAAGDIDSRLLILLPALAAMHPIQILGFGDPGPGASPGVPWCSADLSGSGRAAGMADASYVSWLTTFVRAQLLPFAGSITTLRQDGQLVVRIEFSRPSPLGLLAHGAI
jgi:tetratricopeptide (TPR) repeat protein